MTSLHNRYHQKSIRISPDGFSFCRIEGNKSKTADFPVETGALITVEAERFFTPGDQITVISATDSPLLIPTEIYDEYRVFDYLKLHTDTSLVAKTYTETIGEYTALCYLTQEKKNAIEKLGDSAVLRHESSLFFQFLKDSNCKEAVLVSQNPSFFDLMVVHKGSLQLLNRFMLSNAEDTLYYILNTMKQFKIKSPDIFIVRECRTADKVAELLKSMKITPTVIQ